MNPDVLDPAPTPTPYTDEVIKRAEKLCDRAGAEGKHKRQLIRLLKITDAQYDSARRCAVEKGWAVIDGKGQGRRLVDVRKRSIANEKQPE